MRLPSVRLRIAAAVALAGHVRTARADTHEQQRAAVKTWDHPAIRFNIVR